jgi:hypothetical protein
MSSSIRSCNHHQHHVRKNRLNSKRALRKAVQQRRVGLEGSQPVQYVLITLFSRFNRMYECIDDAFNREPFLGYLPPNAPENLQRFKAYLAAHAAVMELSSRAIDMWMRAGGMKEEDNWVPLLVEEMRQKAADKANH